MRSKLGSWGLLLKLLSLKIDLASAVMHLKFL
jgi:hypothetical protein